MCQHDIAVFTSGTREELLRWNHFCRSRTAVTGTVRGEDQVAPCPIKFLAAGVLGGAGYLFSDFGPGFVCTARDWAPPVVLYVKQITQEAEVRACGSLPLSVSLTRAFSLSLTHTLSLSALSLSPSLHSLTLSRPPSLSLSIALSLSLSHFIMLL